MENELMIGKQNMLSLLRKNPLGDILKPLCSEILLLESFVAGTAQIKDRTVYDDMRENDRLFLLREPENRFDENAILVFDEKKRKLGYIPEKDNLVFARLMDAGKHLTAKVGCIYPDGIFRRRISIRIYLEDY